MPSRVRTHRSGKGRMRRIVQGTYRPRDASSKGRTVQGTHCPRDALSKERNIRDFLLGDTFYHVFFPSFLDMMPPGDTLARRWRRLKKRCSFSSSGDNNKLVRSKSFTEQAGLEKTRVLFKKPSPVFFWFFFFFGFFGFFFWFFYRIYLPRIKSFQGFSVSMIL